MKIRLWDRLILLFGVLLSILTALLLLTSGIYVLLGNETLPKIGVLCVVFGVLCLCLSVLLFMMFRRFSNRRHAFVVQQTDNGELRIAVNAIENLVRKCIDMHEEIHVNNMKIRYNREGVMVDLSISLANNISIPLAVASLQKQIKQYLVASSGIDVKEVTVSVESTETGVGDSPYLVSSETAAQSAEAPAAAPKEKKMPLHRRLFSKADQAATVPEPPKPAEEELNADNPTASGAETPAVAVDSAFTADIPEISPEETIPAEQANAALADPDQEKEEERLG